MSTEFFYHEVVHYAYQLCTYNTCTSSAYQLLFYVAATSTHLMLNYICTYVCFAFYCVVTHIHTYTNINAHKQLHLTHTSVSSSTLSHLTDNHVEQAYYIMLHSKKSTPLIEEMKMKVNSLNTYRGATFTSEQCTKVQTNRNIFSQTRNSGYMHGNLGGRPVLVVRQAG